MFDQLYFVKERLCIDFMHKKDIPLCFKAISYFLARLDRVQEELLYYPRRRHRLWRGSGSVSVLR